MKWRDFTFWCFHHWAKLNGLTILFDHPNETSFALLLFACATDGTKRLVIRLAHLQNSAKILVLGLHLCSRIWVCIMIGLLKKSHCWFANQTEGKFGNSVGDLGQGYQYFFLHIYVYNTGYAFVLVYLLCCTRWFWLFKKVWPLKWNLFSGTLTWNYLTIFWQMNWGQ